MENSAFYYLHELEDIIREWAAVVYHRSPCDGLAVPEWPRLRLSPAQMHEVGIARAGLLRIPATPELAYEFLQVRWRTIQHYGVEVDGLRYNGDALNGHRNEKSPYGGIHAGKWPVRVNPDDVRHAWFQEPADNSWHRLDWEHAAGLGTPFSAEAALHARRLAARQGGWPDQARALDELLARWEQGNVAGRRERRMAARLAAERTALPAVPGTPGPRPEPDADSPQADSPRALMLLPGPGSGELPAATGDDDDRRGDLRRAGRRRLLRGRPGGPGVSGPAWSLSRKEGWRRYVDQPARPRPDLLAPARLRQLGDQAREDYDEARHDWHANFGILRTPQLAAVHDELDLIITAGRQDPDRVRGAAVIDALPGLGKTTAPTRSPAPSTGRRSPGTGRSPARATSGSPCSGSA